MLNHICAADIKGKLVWSDVVAAMRSAHQGQAAHIADQLLERLPDSLLSRAAWIDGLGIGVKSVTVVPGNEQRGLPSIQGAMLVFDDTTGEPNAVIDADIVTYWKTAADSVLAATLLAPPDSRHLLIMGAGTVAESLVRAYSELFPQLESVQVCNRNAARAEQLAERLASEGFPVSATVDPAAAARQADIISCATMAIEPILAGEWVQPGTHVDLIGAFRPDMREADDALLKKARIFVDSRDTTLEHIGELKIPLENGVITPDDVLADLYQLVGGACGRQNHHDITLFKNGGGAHLDLMTASVIVNAANG
ncbi:MAG: ornithine cyclodeaminase [Gammaproteobacteria bacterium]|nr:ornithine cyclodeaminase [Gammaproteobacteria bacterium]